VGRIIVHTSEPSSGAARYVSELVAGLAANHVNVTLFCPPTFDQLDKVRSSGAAVSFAAHRSTERGGFVSRVARNLRFLIGTALRQLRATRPGDILHVQFPLYFPAGLAFFVLARWRQCEIVFTVHDPLPHKWLLPARLRSLEWAMVRWAYGLSDKLIVHNETGRNVLIERFHQNPGKIVVIPHGPLAATGPVDDAPRGEFRVLLFGGIRENKGVHLAIQAVQSINACGAVQVQLTIAGAVANAREQDYWEHCLAMITEHPAGIRVIDRYIEDDETASLTAEHHALLLPYLGFTSESGVAAFALANRRPIIATRAGGLGAILDQCGCGVPIEDSSAEGVAEAIVRAREAGPDVLRQMGIAGARFMEAGRSWTEIGRRTLALYREMDGARDVRQPAGAPRLLLLITTLTFGGAETQVIRLAIELSRRGWLVKIVCLIDPNAYLNQLAEEQIEVESLGMPRGVPDPRAIWRLRRIIRSWRPDIVHSHMVHANLLGRFTRLFCRMPALISTAHNLQERSEKGGATWHKELLYRATDFLADRTTIICGAAFDRYVRVGAVPARKLELIPNGIDTRRFCPSPEARESTRNSLGVGRNFVWLAVGRLVEQKNYSGLLRALTMLPGGDWVVLVAGSGPLAESLRAECDELKLTGRVRFLGADEDIRRLYCAADGFVMSSNYEGLSIALLEAASMGLPAVVTDVGGNAEVVDDGVSGYVVEPGNPTRLAEAMEKLQNAPAGVRRSFGHAAREHCQKAFSLETIVDRWIQLYNRYLSDRPVSQSRQGSNFVKILYVITRAERGGAQVHLLDLLANLPPEIKPVIATGEDGFLCEEATSLGVPVRRIPHLTQPISPLNDLLALGEIIDTIRQESPDLVHAHTSKAGLLARLAARRTRIPAVFTAHTWSFADGISAGQRWLAMPIERFAASLGGKIISVSQANKDMALRRAIAPPDAVVRIWNGVPDVPLRADPGSGNPLTLVMIARCVPQKDHLLLIEALSRLQGDWRLRLVGDGPLRVGVEEAISKAGLGDRVQCLGDRSDVASLLAAADLFVLATRWEGLPLCILEAMRAGLPVVATDVGGVREAVTDGVTGYLTRSGDVQQMRSRVRELLGSRALLQSMGAAARARYERDFNVHNMARATWALYREVMEVSAVEVLAESVAGGLK
jgi:glycosyltransferase involved in cell wall biosynthesis